MSFLQKVLNFLNFKAEELKKKKINSLKILAIVHHQAFYISMETFLVNVAPELC